MADPSPALFPLSPARPIVPPPIERRWHSAGPLRLHSVTVGPRSEATGLVLVHGMVVAGRAMLPLARALWTHGVASTVVDLPGFGLSEKPRRALDVDGLADALARWAQAASCSGATFLGNSFGTQAVIALAERHPGTARRLVLSAPTIDPRFGRRRWRLLPAGRGELGAARRARASALRGALLRELVATPPDAPTPPLGALIRREYLAAGPARALSTYRHALRDAPEQRAPRVEVPVLVVRGTDDSIASTAWALTLTRSFPAARLEGVPGAGHDVAFAAPAPLATTIARFVGRV